METLSLTTRATTLEVALNRPASRNAMNLLMCDELIATFGALQEQARVVVLRAEGPAFCAGVDLKELVGCDAAWVLMRRNRGLDAFLAIERCTLPVVGVLHGAVFGAGAEIAAACDFLVAADTAVFQWPEALRGAVGATQRLPRSVGRSMAKELLFTARKITAQEAQALGFVNRVVPEAALGDAVAEITTAIARCGPIAVRLIKQAINLGENRDRASAVDLERQLIEQSLQHDEWRVALNEFAQNPRS